MTTQQDINTYALNISPRRGTDNTFFTALLVFVLSLFLVPTAAYAAISFGNITSDEGFDDLSFAAPAVSGSDTVMVFGVSQNCDCSGASATYNSVDLGTPIEGSHVDFTSTYVWIVPNPVSGATFSVSSDGAMVAFAAYYTGVDQSTTYRTPTTGGGASNPSLSVTNSQTDDLIVGFFSANDTEGAGYQSGGVGGGQTYRLAEENSSEESNLALSDEPGAAGSVTHSWTYGEAWSGVAVPLIPVTEAGAWYDSDYTYCRKMTMTAGGNSGGVATTTTGGFALVATSTLSSLRTIGNGGHIASTTNEMGTTTPGDVIITNGTDCTTDGGSTALDFYFEKYVPTTGEFVLWVEPLDISSTTPKSILMYYGNASVASNQYDEAGVFGALGESAVWNLHEDPSCSSPTNCVLDSTSNNNDGDPQAGMTSGDYISGYLDGAMNFDNGSTDDINIPFSSSINLGGSSFTWSAWIRATSFPQTWHYIYSFDGNSGDYWFDTENNDASCGFSGGSDEDHTAASSNLSTDVWYYITCTFDNAANTVNIYVNGALSDSQSETNAPGTASSGTFYIGSYQGSGDVWNGDLDDLRLYKANPLHSMDILTVYNNTRSSTVFWTFGSEETESGGGSEPTVTTDAATGVAATSATVNATITDNGGVNATTCGFAWGTATNLSGGDTATTTNSPCPVGTGSFYRLLSSLTNGQTYYFRAYATNSAGTGYGTIASFPGTSRVMRLLGNIRLRGVRLLGI